MNEMNQKETNKRKRQEERFVNKNAKTSAKYLRRIEELTGTPDALAPFLETLRRVYVNMENPLAGTEKKKVGTYCVMAPQELIYAAGAVPVKLCSGNYTAFSVGDDIFPRDSCPLVKAIAGFQDMDLMPVYRDCSLMAVPLTCDCKKRIVEMLEKTHAVYPLHVPAGRDDEDIDRYVGELYGFIERLEELTGEPVSWRSLSEGMNTVGRAKYELSRFLELKKNMPYLMRGTHILAAMNASAYMPADLWADLLHSLNEELGNKIRKQSMAEQ